MRERATSTLLMSRLVSSHSGIGRRHRHRCRRRLECTSLTLCPQERQRRPDRQPREARGLSTSRFVLFLLCDLNPRPVNPIRPSISHLCSVLSNQQLQMTVRRRYMPTVFKSEFYQVYNIKAQLSTLHSLQYCKRSNETHRAAACARRYARWPRRYGRAA